MNKNTIIAAIVLIIVLVFVLVKNVSININTKGASSPVQASTTTQSSKGGLETRENTEGPVSITITPDSLENNIPTWNFEIALNTHSGSIDSNIVAVSEMVDDKGNVYKPVSWDGSAPGGHHRSGVLKFNPITPTPKSLELKIKDVGGISERSFKWDL